MPRMNILPHLMVRLECLQGRTSSDFQQQRMLMIQTRSLLNAAVHRLKAIGVRLDRLERANGYE
ncbi:hypothetical protein D3C86_1760810 [compost metagenome]